MKTKSDEEKKKSQKQRRTPNIRAEDRAASGVPASGWAIGDRFSWEEILQRLLASADEEISHGKRELFFSGITAGFAIVVTFIGYAVGSAYFPENHFLGALLYPIGFIYIILGRYQLFTENTLPPVKLVMTRLASLPLLLRLWGVVLIGNVIGAAFGAFVLANTQVMSPEAMAAGAEFTRHGLKMAWADVFFKALFAGWIVAGIVWMCVAARDTMSRLAIIYIGFYLIAAANLFHVVTTACEVFYFIFLDISGPGVFALIWEFWIPVLLGNTAGGVLLFTFIGYAQAEEQRQPEVRVLSFRELLFSMKGGRSHKTPRPRSDSSQKE